MMLANHGFMGGFMWIFWVAVIVGIIFLVKWAMQIQPSCERSELNYLEILKKRYARGEIERDEYEQKSKDLLP